MDCRRYRMGRRCSLTKGTLSTKDEWELDMKSVGTTDKLTTYKRCYVALGGGGALNGDQVNNSGH